MRNNGGVLGIFSLPGGKDKGAAVLTALAAVLLQPALARACAVCITGSDDSTAAAYDWSVLFLMTTPYLVLASIGGYLFYAYRRAVRGNAREVAINRAQEDSHAVAGAVEARPSLSLER
jgi:hypothetical protein